jgi:hypothetical protein
MKQKFLIDLAKRNEYLEVKTKIDPEKAFTGSL